MTGHQTHFGTPKELSTKEKEKQGRFNLKKVIQSLGVSQLSETDAYNMGKLEKLFYRNFDQTGLRIIIINEECALEKKRRIRREGKQIKKGKREQVYYNLLDTCVKCNECIERLGCPAINARYITKNDGEKKLKYYIDEARCVSEVCPGICKAVCKNNAILKSTIYKKLKEFEENTD